MYTVALNVQENLNQISHNGNTMLKIYLKFTILTLAIFFNTMESLASDLKDKTPDERVIFYPNGPVFYATVDRSWRSLPKSMWEDEKALDKNKYVEPLHQAAKTDDVEEAILLISNGVDINGGYGYPRDWNFTNSQTALHEAAANNAPNVTKLLLDAGALTNIENTQDQYPLDVAIKNKSNAVLRLFFIRGLLPQLEDLQKQNQSALINLLNLIEEIQKEQKDLRSLVNVTLSEKSSLPSDVLKLIEDYMEEEISKENLAKLNILKEELLKLIKGARIYGF